MDRDSGGLNIMKQALQTRLRPSPLTATDTAGISHLRGL